MARSDSGKIGRRLGIPLAVAGIAAGAAVAYVLVSRRRSLVVDGIVMPCEDGVSVYMVGDDEPVFEPADVGSEAPAAAMADATGDESSVAEPAAGEDEEPAGEASGNGGEALAPAAVVADGDGDADADEEPERTRRNGLIDIEGIGPVYAKTLADLGLLTTTELLQAGANPKGREDLAAATGISKKLILRWVNQADLFRIKGVGEQYADLLEAAGVDTVPELAQRRADNLTKKMNKVNEQKRLVRRTPTEAQVASWIESAKGLPRVVTY
jgi:predicted flap endonuclease-1-like 5' DNA nuclease